MRSPGFTPDFVNYLNSLETRMAQMMVEKIAEQPSANVDSKIDDVKKLIPTQASIDSKIDAVKATIPTESSINTKIDDIKKLIPSPGEATPMIEKPGGSPGENPKLYALWDHSHPRISQVIKGTLNASSQATINFTMVHDEEPGIGIGSIGASFAVFWDFEFIKNTAGKITGVTITGRKGRALPALTSVLTSLVTTLSGYDPFSGSASGVKFTGLAIKA